MTDAPQFIHLRLHTEYSLLEGAVPVKKLAGLCEKHSMPAVAVTDTDNMFCALEFSEYASGAGVQPIIGCQVSVAYDTPAQGETAKPPAPLVLLAQNETGYENLMKLNTCLYVDKHDGVPQVTLDELAAHSDGLICLTGGSEGPLGKVLQTGNRAEAEALLARLATSYPERLYIELQRHPVETGQLPEPERLSERGFIEMAYAHASAAGRDQRCLFPESQTL